MIPKAQPVSILIEQGGGNVGGMGWRLLSGGIAALWTQTICAIVSSNLENRYFFKTGPVEAVIEWGGINVGGMGVGVLESTIVRQHGTTMGSDCWCYHPRVPKKGDSAKTGLVDAVVEHSMEHRRVTVNCRG